MTTAAAVLARLCMSLPPKTTFTEVRNADVVQRRGLSCRRKPYRLWAVSPSEICARPSQHCRVQSGSRFDHHPPHPGPRPKGPPAPLSCVQHDTAGPDRLKNGPTPLHLPPLRRSSPFMHHSAAECTQAQGPVSSPTPPSQFHHTNAACGEITVWYLHLEPGSSTCYAFALSYVMLRLPGQLRGSCTLPR